MVIISSCQENKENYQNNSFIAQVETPINYSDKFDQCLKMLFTILTDFFPKTNFKELDNSVKKVFNLVVKTPTEFNKKPLDDLYLKLDKVYNKNAENDVSLCSNRSYYMEGLASPKISETSLGNSMKKKTNN